MQCVKLDIKGWKNYEKYRTHLKSKKFKKCKKIIKKLESRKWLETAHVKCER